MSDEPVTGTVEALLVLFQPPARILLSHDAGVEWPDLGPDVGWWFFPPWPASPDVLADATGALAGLAWMADDDPLSQALCSASDPRVVRFVATGSSEKQHYPADDRWDYVETIWGLLEPAAYLEAQLGEAGWYYRYVEPPTPGGCATQRYAVDGSIHAIERTAVLGMELRKVQRVMGYFDLRFPQRLRAPYDWVD